MRKHQKKLVINNNIKLITNFCAKGTGKIFTCGDGRYGKLGLEENKNNVHELTFAAKYQELFATNVITFLS